MPIWEVVLLGLIEGLTEFLPVSSTGHLLLTEHFLGVYTPGKTFEVLIQLGAILAILSVYSVKLTRIALAISLRSARAPLRASVLLAFLPAAVIGALAHDFIKTVLFETPMLICRHADRRRRRAGLRRPHDACARYHDAMDYRPRCAFKIGLFQCLAIVPGVSRSGSTIVGANAARRRQAVGSGVLVFSRHADHGGRFRLRSLQELVGRCTPSDVTNIVDRIHHRLHRRRCRRAVPARLRQTARLRGVRLVAYHRRRHRARRHARARADHGLPGLS